LPRPVATCVHRRHRHRTGLLDGDGTQVKLT
jgi:hypothetical protein